MDTFLTYAIPLCALLAGLSAFFDKWSTWSQQPIFLGRPPFKTEFLAKTWFKVTYFFAFAVIAFALNKCNSDRSDRKKQSDYASQEAVHRKYDDSLQTVYKNEIRATNDSNIHTFTKSLQAYNLSYDSAQEKVYKKLNSFGTNQDKPSLDITTGGPRIWDKLSDSFKITFEFHNSGNCFLNLTLHMRVAMRYSNGRMFANPKGQIGIKNYPLGIGMTDFIPVPLTPPVRPTEFYFLVTGEYSNSKHTIVNKIDALIVWDLETNTSGGITNIQYRDSIENVIKHLPNP